MSAPWPTAAVSLDRVSTAGIEGISDQMGFREGSPCRCCRGQCDGRSPSCARGASGHAAAAPSPAMNSRRFDHLVGAAEQREREREPERPGGLQVDDELDLRGLLHGEIGRLFALEDAAGISSGKAICIGRAAPITHQTTGLDELTELVDRGDRMSDRQSCDLTPLAEK
jgi:hypothetical protein